MNKKINHKKQIIFIPYRYQIVLIGKNITPELFPSINNLSNEEILNQKNQLFIEELLVALGNLKSKNSIILNKILINDKDEFIIRIGVKKDIQLHDKEFKENKIEDYPNFLIYINNNKDIQEIIIERNYRSFTSTDVVINLLNESVNRLIDKYNLVVYITPIIEEKEFWSIVKKYNKRITQLQFEFFKPNMANLRGAISDDLKNLQNITNSHKTRIELNAFKDRYLENIEEENIELTELVEHASDGGGDITLRAKGVRSKIVISKKAKKDYYIDEIEIKGKNPEEILRIFREITND